MIELSAAEETLRDMIQGFLINNPDTDLIQLNELALSLTAGPLLTGVSKQRAIEISSELSKLNDLRLNIGDEIVAPDFQPWLDSRKREISLDRWASYRQLLLQRNWSPRVVSGMDEQTDRIVDLMGDPLAEGEWSRRGLVIGEVQSGKTATYIGALNKALDYGYQIIVVIGGHTEDLRRQTQERMDSDLIGIDTSHLNAEGRANKSSRIGVGRIRPDIDTDSITSVQYDFNRKLGQTVNVSVRSGPPTVFVVKKNSRVLRALVNNLTPAEDDQPLTAPLIVIDDESDWASVNTNKLDSSEGSGDAERTAVNRAIIDLLRASRRSSYLGITATPFANILIDDSADHDLFPADYILTLKSPTMYRGVDYYFGDEAGANTGIIDDVDDFHRLLSLKHKKHNRLARLPESLKDAVVAFYIATAERYVREEKQVPSSMMVNASRFNDVQDNITRLVEEEIRLLSHQIASAAPYFGDTTRDRSDVEVKLQKVIDAHFSNLNLPRIADALQLVAESIKVELVNGLTMASRAKEFSRLTREQLADVKKRPVVYVGGNVLARGLTLEGLTVSYFPRHAGAADTLLQMGRWFGYRPGYEDLTRIWTDATVVDYFSYVGEVSAELRNSVALMREQGMTPKEFGLKIRLHPEAFRITAANKTRAGTTITTTGEFSFRGGTFETSSLAAEQESNTRNLETVCSLISKLDDLSLNNWTSKSGSRIWSGAPHELIESVLGSFTNPAPGDHLYGDVFGFRTGAMPVGITDLGRSTGWRIALVNGGEGVVRLPGMPELEDVKGSKRDNAVLIDEGDRSRIDLQNRRVATATALQSVLTDDEKAAAQERKRAWLASNELPGDPTRLSQSDVVRFGLREPLLMIYLVTMEAPQTSEVGDGSTKNANMKARERMVDLVALPAFTLSTPPLSASEEAAALQSVNRGIATKYIVNTVYTRTSADFGDFEESDQDDTEMESATS